MQAIWTTIFYQPIYNALIFLINNITLGDVGFAIIVLTIIVKFVLFPLTKKSIKSQVLMKKIQPEIDEIKNKYKNKEEQAKKTFELYKKHGTSPFSGCFVILLQLPVIFALYWVFYKGLSFDSDLLYTALQAPEALKTNFLGLIEMHDKSIVLGVLAGLSQFIHGQLSVSLKKTEKKGGEKNFQDQLAASMNTNVKYILPIFIAFIAYKISAAVALYWIVSNVFTIIQEWYIRKKMNF
ncbi:MAG: YidC/Oxa1 family membrane protein insertase [Patescibacteria group bacterium]|nr:YidC/Oxa1 family membrane protein insertase [Patescibacteria group bacterium]